MIIITNMLISQYFMPDGNISLSFNPVLISLVAVLYSAGITFYLARNIVALGG